MEQEKEKKLVLMRHGQTVFNEKKRIQGWCDAPLTPLGKAQALHAADFVHSLGLDFDLLGASTSERACDTLELVMPGQPYTRYKGLKEINFGRFEGEPESLNPTIADYSTYFQAAGGETREEAAARLNETLQQMMEDHHTVFAVSHGGAMKNFARLWPASPDVDLKKRFFNACVLVFAYDPENRSFYLEQLFNEDYTGQDLEKEQSDKEAKQPALEDFGQESSKEFQQLEKAEAPSSKKKLVLMRHGQTLFNEKKQIQGWADAPLTPLGKAQVLAARPTAQAYIETADHLYASTSERASDTLELVSDRPYTRLKGLKEISFGIFEGESEHIAATPLHWEIAEKKNTIEPRQEGFARFEKTVRDLMKKDDHEQVFLVSHGSVMSHFLQQQENPWQYDVQAKMQNAAIAELEYDPQTKEFTLMRYFNGFPVTESEMEKVKSF